MIEKALSVEPKYRYPDAGEFWDALVAAAGAAPSVARATPPGSSRDAMMGTAEFAAKANLNVSTQGLSPASKLPLQSTIPAESVAVGAAHRSAVVGSTAQTSSSTDVDPSPPLAMLPPVRSVAAPAAHR